MSLFESSPKNDIHFLIDRSSQEIDFACVKNHIAD